MRHKPVLLHEVLEFAAPKPGDVVVDGTLGSGGHAAAIADVLGEAGRLIGLDQDVEALKRCESLQSKGTNIELVNGNFRNLKEILRSLNIHRVNAVLLDIGFSSDQLEDSERGISFERDGPLDMRLNRSASVQASDLIRDLSQMEVERIFRDYGEERYFRKFAQVIVNERRHRPILTTFQLIEVLKEAFPEGFFKNKDKGFKIRGRHFATKIFQALRIAVNDELGALEQGLQEAWDVLAEKGRLVVISFHSLEDRIVKNQFREWHQQKQGKKLTPKPVIATKEEIAVNPRARSAKLRAIVKN